MLVDGDMAAVSLLWDSLRWCRAGLHAPPPQLTCGGVDGMQMPEFDAFDDDLEILLERMMQE